MKKLLFLLPLILVGLTGCGTKAKDSINNKDINSTEEVVPNSNKSSIDSSGSDGPIETVELSAENFSTYVASNTTASFNVNNNSVLYFTHFIGADYCKFINCTVTYTYITKGAAVPDSGETVPLTLSGDGQAYTQNARANAILVLAVVAASGTIEVYR